MIKHTQFDLKKLVDCFLEDNSGNRDIWRRQCEIIVDYMPPHPTRDTKPTCIVRIQKPEESHIPHNDHLYLRYSKGPAQGFFWDIYGEDFQTPELAFRALLEAPVPPCAIKREYWERRKHDKMVQEGSISQEIIDSPEARLARAVEAYKKWQKVEEETNGKLIYEIPALQELRKALMDDR